MLHETKHVKSPISSKKDALVGKLSTSNKRSLRADYLNEHNLNDSLPIKKENMHKSNRLQIFGKKN